MKTDRERMPLILRRTTRGLEPQSRMAADMLAEYALHSDFEVAIKKRRSLPQLRLYWAMLQNVVDATGRWPSAEHLHDAIKVELGYVTPIIKFDGSLEMVPDSAAMGKMDGPTFKRFFDSVVKMLAEQLGFDPLADMEQRRDAA